MRLMKYLFIVFIAMSIIGNAENVSAQVSLPSPVPTTTKISWDAPTPDPNPPTGFNLYIDNVKTDVMKPVPVGNTYSIPFPAMTPGSHTITVTSYNIKGESAKSNILTLSLIINVPAIPTNLRIVP